MYNFIGTEWSYILCSLQTIRIMTFASYEGVQEGEILYIWIHFPLSFTGCMPLGFFVCGRTIFLCMFSHVFQQEVREGNMGEMDTPLFNLPNNS